MGLIIILPEVLHLYFSIISKKDIYYFILNLNVKISYFCRTKIFCQGIGTDRVSKPIVAIRIKYLKHTDFVDALNQMQRTKEK